MDVAAKTGTVVVAPADGVISLSVPDMFYSGGTMVIDHGYGVSSSFLHLSKLYVNAGEAVKQGQAVAEVGSTGRANGAFRLASELVSNAPRSHNHSATHGNSVSE